MGTQEVLNAAEGRSRVNLESSANQAGHELEAERWITNEYEVTQAFNLEIPENRGSV
jgi:hypothetical protein